MSGEPRNRMGEEGITGVASPSRCHAAPAGAALGGPRAGSAISRRRHAVLDEIGDMPLLAQGTLLRVLQEQEYERVGGSATIRVNVRVLAATHRDLNQLVSEGRFRPDLYYRMNVVPIALPPLRERPDDIVPLVYLFVNRFNTKHGTRIERVSESSLDHLRAYDWPGNVRELENVIERAVLLSNGPVLDLSQVILSTQTERERVRAEPGALPHIPTVVEDQPAAMEFSGTVEELQREYMLQVLERTRWVIEGQYGAAAQLGLKPSTLRNRMHKLGIHKLGPSAAM